jgi:hypothetical protein
MPRPDDPPSAPASPAAAPERRRRIGLVAGIAVILVAIVMALVFGLSGNGDPGRTVTAVAAAQDGEIQEPPPGGAPDPGFGALALRAGWRPVGARSDEIDGRTITTVFWGRAGRRIAESVLPGDPVPAPTGSRRTGRRGLLLYSFDVGPRTAVTWTEDGRTTVISAIGVGRGRLYDLAGGPPRRP